MSSVSSQRSALDIQWYRNPTLRVFRSASSTVRCGGLQGPPAASLQALMVIVPVHFSIQTTASEKDRQVLTL